MNRVHRFSDESGAVLEVEQAYADQRTEAHIARTLTYHPPSRADQAPRFAAITRAARNFAELLGDLCPPSAELTLAIRAVEEARMRANQAIATNEFLPAPAPVAAPPPVVGGTPPEALANAWAEAERETRPPAT